MNILAKYLYRALSGQPYFINTYKLPPGFLENIQIQVQQASVQVDEVQKYKKYNSTKKQKMQRCKNVKRTKNTKVKNKIKTPAISIKKHYK